MKNIKAVVADSDITILNSWFPIAKIFLSYARKYQIDRSAMNKKYGIFDAAGSGPFEFMPDAHRESFYQEYVQEVTQALKETKKLVSLSDREAMIKLKDRGIPLYMLSGNYEEITRGSVEHLGNLVKEVYGYRRADYERDLQRNFSPSTTKRDTLRRLLKNEGLDRSEIILIDDGPRMIEESKDVPDRYLIHSIGIPGTNIRLPLPKFANGGSKRAWSFSDVVEKVVN